MRLTILILTLTAFFTLQTIARPLRSGREVFAPKLDDRNKAPTLLGAHVVHRGAGSEKRKAWYARAAAASPREDGGQLRHRVLQYKQREPKFAPERAQELLSHAGPTGPPAAAPPVVDHAASAIVTPPPTAANPADAAAQTTMPTHERTEKAKAEARKPTANNADGKRHPTAIKKIRTGRWH